MTEKTSIRPPAVIRITGPDGEEQTITLPELVIETPYPQERPEPTFENQEET